jgi:glycosyltransferase involved in cell wall biosynthesis
MSQARKLISIVTPVFNEEDNVQACHDAVRTLFAEKLPGYDYEHIFADNRSTDQTVAILRRIATDDKRVKVICNARNFGPFQSVFHAILQTTGDATVALLAADLQDPPEIIVEFVRHWENGHEIAYGIRQNRDENAVMRFLRARYYDLIYRLTDIKLPAGVGEFQLIDRKVVDALRQVDDYYPYIRGLIAMCGFNSVGVPYTWRRRARGFSKNRLYHCIDQGLNGLISFTKIPMRICMLIGIAVAAVSILSALALVIVNIIFYRQFAPPGIPTLIIALLFFSGLQLFFFGVLGEYLGAVHSQVRRRPLVVERERINF